MIHWLLPDIVICSTAKSQNEVQIKLLGACGCSWKNKLNLAKKQYHCIRSHVENIIVIGLFLTSNTFGVEITHRFLEKSHSQSEGDSTHSTIERVKKRQTIFNPDQIDTSYVYWYKCKMTTLQESCSKVVKPVTLSIDDKIFRNFWFVLNKLFVFFVYSWNFEISNSFWENCRCTSIRVFNTL